MFFFFITRNLNWEMLAKNLATFNPTRVELFGG